MSATFWDSACRPSVLSSTSQTWLNLQVKEEIIADRAMIRIRIDFALLNLFVFEY
jgi:hypothetical protein